MEHYLKPTIDKDPAKVILHIGTNVNDLKARDPNTVADHIVDLAKKIENESNAQVILSEVVSRSDDVPSDPLKLSTKNFASFVLSTAGNLFSTVTFPIMD